VKDRRSLIVLETSLINFLRTCLEQHRHMALGVILFFSRNVRERLYNYFML